MAAGAEKKRIDEELKIAYAPPRSRSWTGEGTKMSAGDATIECAPTVLKTARVLDLVAAGQRADPRVPLLIRGERGTGKDILARLIHAASARQPHSFVKVNCAAQPADRSEADLFGHERGASPLASRRRPGSFEFANHGTIYLDEIGALPRALIPKLLHVLRTGEVSRTGGRELLPIDVRVIASTVQSADIGRHEYLWKELQALNMVEVCVPPLRQRTEEIPVFASFFLEQFNRRYRRDVQLCADALTALIARSWPVNIRELEEAVHRFVVGGAPSPTH